MPNRHPANNPRVRQAANRHPNLPTGLCRDTRQSIWLGGINDKIRRPRRRRREKHQIGSTRTRSRRKNEPLIFHDTIRPKSKSENSSVSLSSGCYVPFSIPLLHCQRPPPPAPTHPLLRLVSYLRFKEA